MGTLWTRIHIRVCHHTQGLGKSPSPFSLLQSPVFARFRRVILRMRQFHFFKICSYRCKAVTYMAFKDDVRNVLLINTNKTSVYTYISISGSLKSS